MRRRPISAVAGSCSTAWIRRELRVWWQWWPGGPMWIDNLEVAPGDQMSGLICLDLAARSGLIILGNVTSKEGATFSATAPAGEPLAGNSAEWIVQALMINSPFPALARYGSVYFDSAFASTVGAVLLDAGSGNTINMVSSGGGRVISAPVLVTPSLVKVSYTGA
jgi:hypothetical protein